MSSRREIIVKLTEEQRNEIREKLDKDVSHVKLWTVPGPVVLAEAMIQPEAPDVR